MYAYFIRRFLLMIPTFVGMTFLCFTVTLDLVCWQMLDVLYLNSLFGAGRRSILEWRT